MNANRMQFLKNKSKIQAVLDSALRTPYYCEKYKTSNAHLINSYEDFARLPITEKEDYRKNYEDFIRPQYIESVEKEVLCNPIKDLMAEEYLFEKGFLVFITSGSTGMPMVIIRHTQDQLAENLIINKYRNMHCEGIVSETHVWLLPLNEYLKNKYYSFPNNYAAYNKYGFQYFIAEYNKENFLEFDLFLAKKKIKWIIASPSLLMEYISTMNKMGRYKKNDILYIECISEMLFEWQRDIIYNFFGVYPISVYGANELPFIGISCSHGHMHLLSSNVFLEVITNNRGFSEFIVTSLNSHIVPLIRYRIGDVGSWGESNCNSLRNNPTIQLTGYRINDKIIKADGSLVEPWIFNDFILLYCNHLRCAITQWQVVQKDYDWFTITLRVETLPQKNIKGELLSMIYKGVANTLKSKVTIDIFYTLSIIPSDKKSNKFKYFICEMNSS